MLKYPPRVYSRLGLSQECILMRQTADYIQPSGGILPVTPTFINPNDSGGLTVNGELTNKKNTVEYSLTRSTSNVKRLYSSAVVKILPQLQEYAYSFCKHVYCFRISFARWQISRQIITRVPVKILPPPIMTRHS
jgi:hypothetical protein